MLNVTKASGQKEPFDENKLRLSIQRANISPELINQVISDVKSKLYEGIKTSEIYNFVDDFLDISIHPFSPARYSLKQAIMNMGPTGYPFEDYISEILKTEGYKTIVRQTFQGKCVSHEVDIVAEINNIKFMIECKFHNKPGTKSQIHVSLYTKARFDDLKKINSFDQAWLITNTKLTSDALAYAQCENIKVLSWNYPPDNNFVDLIEKHKLQPITNLKCLSVTQQQQLLQKHACLVKNIYQNPGLLDPLGLPKEKREQVLAEAKYISMLR
jgi:hypothetical protein